MSYSGKFKPRNPRKYIGDSTNIIYRSTWERKIFNWLDKGDNILAWASEEFWIPYRSPVDGKMHRYFCDILVKIKTKDNKIKTMLLEIKPEKQTRPPEKQKRVTKRYITEVTTWGVNQAKWNAAQILCEEKGWEFGLMVSNDGSKFYLKEYIPESL